MGDFINFYWITFRSNLGGAPPKIAGDDKTPLRVIVFAIFFASTIVWMAYRLRDFQSCKLSAVIHPTLSDRASLTSELVTRQRKMPFEDLEDLLNLDFQLVTWTFVLADSSMFCLQIDHQGRWLYWGYFQESRWWYLL